MAKIYFEAVQAGKRTLESVPKRWRDKVSEMLQWQRQNRANL